MRGESMWINWVMVMRGERWVWRILVVGIPDI